MKTILATIAVCAALLPLAGLAGGGSMSSTRFLYKHPTEAQRQALQQERDQAAQQNPATQSAAGAPGPLGVPGPGSGQSPSQAAPHR